jgi:hypothetical protein
MPDGDPAGVVAAEVFFDLFDGGALPAKESRSESSRDTSKVRWIFLFTHVLKSESSSQQNRSVLSVRWSAKIATRNLDSTNQSRCSHIAPLGRRDHKPGPGASGVPQSCHLAPSSHRIRFQAEQVP